LGQEIYDLIDYIFSLPGAVPGQTENVYQTLATRSGLEILPLHFTRFARMPPSLLGGGMASGGLGAAAPNTIILLGMPRSLLRGGLLYATLTWLILSNRRVVDVWATRSVAESCPHIHSPYYNFSPSPPVTRYTQIKERSGHSPGNIIFCLRSRGTERSPFGNIFI